MGMTMSQKILAAHAGLSEVKAGQLIEAKLDMVLGNDVTSPVAINVFEQNGATAVFDNTKIAMIMDHFTPNKDIKAATQVKQVRTFADKYDIKNYRDVGQMGIEHALCLNRVLSDLVVCASVQTRTPVHTVHSVHFRQVSAQQIWPQV